jgi:hypothetical protein
MSFVMFFIFAVRQLSLTNSCKSDILTSEPNALEVQAAAQAVWLLITLGSAFYPQKRRRIFKISPSDFSDMLR